MARKRAAVSTPALQTVRARRGREPETAANYLVNARCTRADVFHGTSGGLLRRIAQKRIRAEGPAVLEGLRRKLESGMPAR